MQFNIDKFISEAAFIYRRAVVSLAGISNDNGIKNIQKAFCFLWTYIATALDMCLYKQQKTIDELQSKQDLQMQEKVGQFKKGLEQ